MLIPVLAFLTDENFDVATAASLYGAAMTVSAGVPKADPCCGAS